MNENSSAGQGHEFGVRHEVGRDKCIINLLVDCFEISYRFHNDTRANCLGINYGAAASVLLII